MRVQFIKHKYNVGESNDLEAIELFKNVLMTMTH